MPDSTNEEKGAPPPASGEKLSVHFNPVMREQTTTQILAPQVDPAVRRRTRVLIALVALVFITLIVMSLLSSDLLKDLSRQQEPQGFGPPQQSFPQ